MAWVATSAVSGDLSDPSDPSAHAFIAATAESNPSVVVVAGGGLSSPSVASPERNFQQLPSWAGFRDNPASFFGISASFDVTATPAGGPSMPLPNLLQEGCLIFF